MFLFFCQFSIIETEKLNMYCNALTVNPLITLFKDVCSVVHVMNNTDYRLEQWSLQTQESGFKSNNQPYELLEKEENIHVSVEEVTTCKFNIIHCYPESFFSTNTGWQLLDKCGFPTRSGQWRLMNATKWM